MNVYTHGHLRTYTETNKAMAIDEIADLSKNVCMCVECPCLTRQTETLSVENMYK